MSLLQKHTLVDVLRKTVLKFIENFLENTVARCNFCKITSRLQICKSLAQS